MASSMQMSSGGPPSTTGGMGGMEEAADTIGVPPLVDSRTLMQFSQAIQQFADRTGFHDEAQNRIQQLLARLDKLQDLATLCRLAVLGLPGSCERLRDELECVAVDFPTAPIVPPNYTQDGYQGPAQLTAAMDLFVGAAFVSKDDLAQRDRFIIGVVRAIEDAISYPVTYAPEAAEYLRGTTSRFPSVQVEAVIANATSRFLEGDLSCDPRLPLQVRGRLEHLACKWMKVNPVTELFRSLTGPRWRGVLQSIQPDTASVGEEITLGLSATCADQMGDSVDPKGKPGSDAPNVLFCPRQPAEILRYSGDDIVVRVPPGSRSGPIAIVRDFGATLLGDIIYLLDLYACEYSTEWFYSVFTMIPMWQWAYPAAFDGPRVQIPFVPQGATISAFSGAGMLGSDSSVQVNDTVVIYYQVDPPGSDQQVPLQASASSGSLSNLGIPGAIGFTPSDPGDSSVNLSWGTLSSTIVVHVSRQSSAGGS